MRVNALVSLLALPLIADAGQIIDVSVEKTGERYEVKGEIVIDASAAAVFRLLTHYDALDQLDKGIAESRLVERVDDTTALVYTKLKGCILFFCRKVERVESVREKYPHELITEVVPEEGHILYAQSRWLLTTEETGTRISFTTEVEPDFWIPGVIGPGIIKRNLKKRVERTLDNLEEAARAYEQ